MNNTYWNRLSTDSSFGFSSHSSSNVTQLPVFVAIYVTFHERVLFNINKFVFQYFFRTVMCSQSNDAIVYGASNENFLQRETSDIGVFEFSTNYNWCRNCHNDRTIIRYDWIDLCIISHTRFFPPKYSVKKSLERYRHTSSAFVTHTWSFSIISLLTCLAVYRLFPHSKRTHNRKWKTQCFSYL